MKSSLLKNGLLGMSLATTAAIAHAGSVDPEQVVRPAGTSAATASQEELLNTGEALWTDPSLGNSNLSCASCHKDNVKRFKESFWSLTGTRLKWPRKKPVSIVLPLRAWCNSAWSFP